MELIPILSLIILVATISTFILAVGAYILYKVRERRGLTADAPQPAVVPGELITPMGLTSEGYQEEVRRTFADEGYTTRETRETRETRGRQAPVYNQAPQQQAPELRPTFVSTSEQQYYQKPSRATITSEGEKYVPKKKFQRYTSEGYVDTQKKEKTNEDKLRWR
ncbi:hypothetical protein APF79_07620 [bacterium BRH_c32]|nr:MAG: hypothetical protein APF79_07620 [bacterium BRH_c32]